jgi:hypothetical protein
MQGMPRFTVFIAIALKHDAIQTIHWRHFGPID